MEFVVYLAYEKVFHNEKMIKMVSRVVVLTCDLDPEIPSSTTSNT